MAAGKEAGVVAWLDGEWVGSRVWALGLRDWEAGKRVACLPAGCQTMPHMRVPILGLHVGGWGCGLRLRVTAFGNGDKICSNLPNMKRYRQRAGACPQAKGSFGLGFVLGQSEYGIGIETWIRGPNQVAQESADPPWAPLVKISAKWK